VAFARAAEIIENVGGLPQRHNKEMAEPTSPLASPPQPAQHSSIQECVARAASAAGEWAALDAPQRAQFLRACMPSVKAVAEQWVRLSCEAKGVDPASALSGEEWISGPAVLMRHLRLYAETLEGKHPVKELPDMPDGGKQVFPSSLIDKNFLPGHKASLHVGTSGEFNQSANAPAGAGAVAAILGAGNINSIPPLDALYLLLKHNFTSVVKLNPVNDYLQQPLSQALQPLVERGFLQFVCGDLQAAHELLHHPDVAHVHMTGSDRTYDAIVWGDDVEQAKRSGVKKLNKPVTAELGAVTPVLVVPGPWSQADLKFQARHVAGMLSHNTSFNCNAPKLLVLARHWHQRETFLKHLRTELASLPSRDRWYPGAEERWQGFLERYPQAEVYADNQWMLIPDVPLMKQEYACRVEAFCGVIAETSIAAKTPEEFLQMAVPLVNDHVYGSLSCVALAPDHTDRQVLIEAVQQLRYGGVGVNIWGGGIFGLGQPSWGAFPGHTAQDIQSGCGEVHNALLLDDVEKTVLWAPFRPWPKPLYLAGHRRLRAAGKAWLDLEAKPGWWRFAKLALPAMLG